MNQMISYSLTTNKNLSELHNEANIIDLVVSDLYLCNDLFYKVGYFVQMDLLEREKAIITYSSFKYHIWTV